MARKGDEVLVRWKDAEHCEDVNLAQNWSKYKLTTHQSRGIIQHNGKELLVISSSEEQNSTNGDVYIIPKDRWILEIKVLKTKRELKSQS